MVVNKVHERGRGGNQEKDNQWAPWQAICSAETGKHFWPDCGWMRYPDRQNLSGQKGEHEITHMWITGIMVLYQLMTWVAGNQEIPSKLTAVKQPLKDKKLDRASYLNCTGLLFYWFGTIKESWDQQVSIVFTSWIISFFNESFKYNFKTLQKYYFLEYSKRVFRKLILER